MAAQTKPSVLPIYMCVPCYCSGWGNHSRLHYAVESRKKVETLAVQSGQSPELNIFIQDMGITTPHCRFEAEAFTILPYKEVRDVSIISECL